MKQMILKHPQAFLVGLVALFALAGALGWMPHADHGALLLVGLGNIMSPSQARVVDPVLSTVAQGYQNADMVAQYLFPRVPVGQRGGRILQFGKEDFRLYNTARTPGTNTKRVQYGYLGNPYALESHSLEGVVPFENMQEANAVPGINLATGAVRKTQNIVQLRTEYASAQLARNASAYPSSNKTALSGTSQWSDYVNSDPSKDIEAAVEQVRASIGKRANTILIPAKVMSVLRYHPKLLDRIKYTGRDSVTADLLSALWQIPNVVVGSAIYLDDTTDAFADVWGKDVVVAYTELGALSDGGAPSYGYTYRLDGYPLVEMPYQDRNAKSWIYPVTDELSPVVASGIAGFLIQTAVA